MKVYGLCYVPVHAVTPVVVQYVPVYHPVPLRSVSVNAQMVDVCAEVTVKQVYVNSEPTPIEAQYVFPLDERAAVCAFSCDVDGRQIVGEVKEKDEATREYNAAVQQGHGAALLTQEKEDVFKAKIGNILSGSVVTVSITYVVELKTEGDAVRFLLPTTVAPRYTPPGTAPTAQPPTASFAASAAYALDIKLECSMMSAIQSIVSPSHGHVMVATVEGQTATAQLLNAVDMDKDLVVLVTPEKPLVLQACLEHDAPSGSHAAMLTICPQFELVDKRGEYVFVVDRSGSMRGAQMTKACAALQLFLRSLPADCYFNIVGFGSRMEMYERSSVRYNAHSLASATKHINGITANLGGTELLNPLRTVMDRPAIPGYARQVFVLTDGQVSNTEAVVSYVRSQDRHARVFALGIGSAVSRALVEGIARAGNGTAKFAVESTRLEGLVVPQLKQAMQPAIRDVKVDWGTSLAAASASQPPVYTEKAPEPEPSQPPKVKSLLGYRSPNATATMTSATSTATPASRALVKQSPHSLPPVFNGERFQVYCIFEPGQSLPKSVSITAQTPDGPLEATADITEETTVEGLLIHRMAARALLRDLDNGTSPLHAGLGFGSHPSLAEIKREMVTLSKRYNLASTHAAFVAVDVRSLGERLQCGGWTPHVDVPAMAPQQQQQQFRSRGGPMLAAPMMMQAGFGGGGGGGYARNCAAPMMKAKMKKGAGPPPPMAPGGPGAQVAMRRSAAAPAAPAMNSAASAPTADMLCDSFGFVDDSMDNSSLCSSDDDEDDDWEEKTEKLELNSASLLSVKTDKKHINKESSSSSRRKEGGGAEKKNSKSVSPLETMDLIVSTQDVDGSVGLTAALVASVSAQLSQDAVMTACSAYPSSTGSVDTRTIAGTALAIAFLRARLADHKDEWELMVDKSLDFLRAAVGASHVDALLAAVAALL